VYIINQQRKEWKMTYKIVFGTSKEDLETKVKELLAAEWKLQGGVCVVSQKNVGGIYLEFYQAMSHVDR
jgi:Domain of unknown function (DUF1737)